MFKKIKSKLHKTLFPAQAKDIFFLKIQNSVHENEILELKETITDLKKEQSIPKPTMADLMRDVLKLTSVDFVHQEKGVPKHFLDLPDTLDGRDTRKMFIGQLAQIQQLGVWQVMIDNLINTQGNYTLRVAPTDMEVFAGRMMIAGISLVKDDVKKGYDEFKEKVDTKGNDFDPTDHSTEGIPYSADEKDDDGSL